MEAGRATMKRVAVAVACINAVGITLGAIGVSLVVGTVGAILVVVPVLFVIAFVGLSYLQRRRDGEPLPMGDSFGEARIYWLSAGMSVLTGIALIVGMLLLSEGTAAVLLGTSAACFGVSMVLLARHSD
jgi:hypothetical protein